MTDKEDEGRLTPRPLTDTELEELARLARGHYWIMGDRDDLRDALRSMVAEVRDGRRLLREARREFQWGGTVKGREFAERIDAFLSGNAAQPPTDP